MRFINRVRFAGTPEQGCFLVTIPRHIVDDNKIKKGDFIELEYISVSRRNV